MHNIHNHLGQVDHSANNAILRKYHYPVDKCQVNVLHYPPDRDLSGG